MWIGQPGVKAHCHFDGYHNFYAKLVGTKRFILYPPGAWNRAYVYPFLHPHSAQSQLPDPLDPDPEKYPNAQSLLSYPGRLVVTLKAGDLLYLPPLWFHETEAADESISVNVWTEPQEAMEMQQAFEVVGMAVESFEVLQQPLALVLLIQNILSTCGCASSPPGMFVRELVQVRYRYATHGGEGLAQYTGDVMCLSSSHSPSDGRFPRVRWQAWSRRCVDT